MKCECILPGKYESHERPLIGYLRRAKVHMYLLTTAGMDIDLGLHRLHIIQL